MRYFDLHCDTASQLLDHPEYGTLSRGSYQAALCDTASYASYAQVYAIWSRRDLSDRECALRFDKIREKLLQSLHQAIRPVEAYLSVEDGRLICGDPAKVEMLKEAGVCLLTPVWGGVNSLGGAHDTEEGLTPLGREVIRRCLACGILPDVSHASARTFDDIAQAAAAAGRPFVATHSCAMAIHRHTRNLSDSQFGALREAGGIVGVSLCPFHLAPEGQAAAHTVARHILHFLSLGGEKNVCLGGDLDGVEQLPQGIRRIGDLVAVARELRAEGCSEAQLDRIFYQNAADFFRTHHLRPLSGSESGEKKGTE